MSRLDRLQQRVRDRLHARDRITLQPEWDTHELPVSLPERKAYALAMVMDRMPLAIDDDELIVGRRTVFGRRADTELSVNPSNVSLSAYPHYATEEEIVRLGAKGKLTEGSEGSDNPLYVVFTAGEAATPGHNVAGYQTVLEKGLRGIIADAEKAMAHLDDARHPFLRAVMITYTGLSHLILRYRNLALEKASQAMDNRKAELTHIADVLTWIAAQPPRDAQEAVQLYWFTHLAVLMENHGAMCNGRIDQLLAPFEKTATFDEWVDLMGCLIVKLNEQSDVGLGANDYAGSDNLVLGGVRSDGIDGTNTITSAYLEAVDQTRLIGPELSIRLHSGTPDWLISRVTSLIASGVNHIALYNDDTFVPNLVDAGITPEDARDYSIDWCQDISIGGRTSFFLGGQFSLTHTLLEVLKAAPDDLSYDDLVRQYKSTITEKIKAIVRFSNDAEKTPGMLSNTCVYSDNRLGEEVLSPAIFFSGTCEGAIEKGLDILQGGLKYGHKGINLFTSTNAINSLAAIKIAVYDERWLSLAELKKVLADDYAGHETLRLRLEALPKWGNDDDRVDQIGVDLIEFGLTEIRKHRTITGDMFLAGIHQPYNQAFGVKLGATPDGRKAGESVPVGISPVNGTDRHGPTAVMASLAKLNPALCQWNYALALKFHPSLFAGEGKEKFEQLIKGALRSNIMEFQFNVLDDEVLRDAQLHPEKHGDIMVRVWGYSAYFVRLTRSLQDEIIARTVHKAGL